MESLDQFDLKILRELQQNVSVSADDLAQKIGLSRNAAWRRMKNLEERGIIKNRVALLDADKLNLELTVLIFVRTQSHDPEWLAKFRTAVYSFPEITSVWRMTGDLDYVLRARVGSVKAYDHLYQRLIARLPIADVSASFVMEEIKETTALPI